MTSEYIHGSDATEQARLTRMNDRLNTGTLGVLSLAPGMRVLDVGSGLGQVARAIARSAPRSIVIGVERDDQQRRGAVELAAEAGEGDLVEFRAGDALDLPLADRERGTFDLVHSRFLLEHLPDPLAAVRAMAAAARQGGRVHLADDDHALWHMHPACPEWDRTWAAYQRSYEVLGCDPRIGSKLPELLHRAGLEPARSGLVNFGGCRGDPLWDDLVTNMIEAAQTGRRVAVERGVICEGDYDAGLDAARAWAETPGAAIWYPVCWAEGVKA
ncbi:MAG: methyltransferase domain-containing protein [Phycisphaerales bacterium]